MSKQPLVKTIFLPAARRISRSGRSSCTFFILLSMGNYNIKCAGRQEGTHGGEGLYDEFLSGLRRRVYVPCRNKECGRAARFCGMNRSFLPAQDLPHFQNQLLRYDRLCDEIRPFFEDAFFMDDVRGIAARKRALMPVSTANRERRSLKKYACPLSFTGGCRRFPRIPALRP